MKKKVYLVLIFISLCCFFLSLYYKITFSKFSSKNVKNNIEYISSSKFEGRLAGTVANESLAYEIRDEFKKYGLKPLSNNNYLESFNVHTPIYNGKSCSIKILDGNNVIKELAAGKDFKEDMLNFNSSSVQISSEDKVNIYPKSICIEKSDKKYLFYVTFDEGFNFRSSFIYDCPFEFAIQINTNTFNEILSSLRKGYIVDINLPYIIEEKIIYNVVGKIEGNNKKLSPLILCAHFDHVGIDSIGNIYYGALDNASGTAFLLELIKTFSSLKSPERDIIFVALNAEEFGLLGSKNFAEKYSNKFKESYVINFDMIGSSNYPVTFMNSLDSNIKDSKLLKKLESICIDNKLDYLISLENSSDHTSFSKNNFNALTICHSNTSNIHTPNDTFNKISTNSIDSIYKLIEPFVYNYAYNDFTLILYKNYFLIFFSTTTLILIYAYIKTLKKAP